MGLSQNDIKESMRLAIVAATGLPDDSVVFARQNSPRPKEPYAVVNAWTSSSQLGMDEELLDADEPGVINHSGIRKLTASIDVYGPYAMEGAARAADRLSSEAAILHLEAAGLAVTGRTSVNDLAEMLETRWQERAKFDVFLSAVSSWTEDVGWIESVQLQSEFEAGEETLETDTTIPEED